MRRWHVTAPTGIDVWTRFVRHLAGDRTIPALTSTRCSRSIPRPSSRRTPTRMRRSSLSAPPARARPYCRTSASSTSRRRSSRSGSLCSSMSRAPRPSSATRSRTPRRTSPPHGRSVSRPRRVSSSTIARTASPALARSGWPRSGSIDWAARPARGRRSPRSLSPSARTHPRGCDRSRPDRSRDHRRG